MAKYSSESGDIRAIGKELGARYVMEGSLPQAGTKLRFAVQLLDAVSGALSPRLRAGRADRAGLRKPRWPAPRATRHPAALSEAGSGTGRNWEVSEQKRAANSMVVGILFNEIASKHQTPANGS